MSKIKEKLQMDCLWVEYSIYGGTKKCIYLESEILDEAELKVKFCVYCLEGQKVDALNQLSNMFWKVHSEQVEEYDERLAVSLQSFKERIK